MKTDALPHAFLKYPDTEYVFTSERGAPRSISNSPRSWNGRTNGIGRALWFER
jgi:hypothetical protein